MTVTNEKGYRMSRCSLGVSEGNWYFEIKVLASKGNVRIGWCSVNGDVQAPVGFDEYSYSIRDKDGAKFHMSKGEKYGHSFGKSFFCSFYYLISDLIRCWGLCWILSSIATETQRSRSSDR